MRARPRNWMLGQCLRAATGPPGASRGRSSVQDLTRNLPIPSSLYLQGRTGVLFLPVRSVLSSNLPRLGGAFFGSSDAEAMQSISFFTSDFMPRNARHTACPQSGEACCLLMPIWKLSHIQGWGFLARAACTREKANVASLPAGIPCSGGTGGVYRDIQDPGRIT